eukprot:TRINITY_DN5831_c0_g1_i1.p1 TRINITY_DN5831_c0_g1~~TRINITY_DN5831_c0_g1_i1.p1  ORF type:complete len:448 (-),score=91.60 TRINITY_DN5831_c0_g1_i1:1051-2394(-)
MASYSQQITQWLDQVLLSSACYQRMDHAKIRGDILELLRQATSLVPKTGQLPDSPYQLLYLDGTVPIYFQGRQYNTPVKIYLQAGYPHQPPKCFVSPSADSGMVIKTGHKHVATADGQIYLPYLHEWNPRTSNLGSLVATMSSIFSQDPPLRQQTTPVPPPSYNTYPPSQPTPQPLIPPPVPAKPSTTGYPATSPSGYPSTATGYPGSGSGYPYPPASGSPYDSARTSQPASALTPYPAATPPPATQYSPQPGPPPSSTFSSYPTYNADHQLRQQQEADNARKRQLVQQLTAKLQQDCDTFRQKASAEMDSAAATQSQLQQSEQQIQQGIALCNTEKSELMRNNMILTQKVAELQEWLAANETSSAPDADAATETRDVQLQQAWTTTAEDAALDDAFHVLDRSLQRQVIDLPTFLRKCRFLAEEQFNKRVLAEKYVQEVLKSTTTAR